MGFGNTTKQSGQSSSNSTSTSTPTEAPQVSGFRNGLYPQIQNLITQGQQPVYGEAQRASHLNNLNQLANNSINQLSNTIAGRGGSLNSGAFGAGAGNILRGRAGSMADYDMQVPMLNQQARQQNTLGALGLATNFAGHAPVSTTTTGSSNGTTSSTETQNQGLGSTLMGVAGAALGGAFPGLGGLFGGGQAGGNSWQQQLFNPFGNQSAINMQRLLAQGQPNYGPSMGQLSGYNAQDPGTWQ